MSPKTNIRTDEYGGTPRARLRFLFEVIDAIRADCPRSFAVGVKLNSADYVVRTTARHTNVNFIFAQDGGLTVLSVPQPVHYHLIGKRRKTKRCNMSDGFRNEAT